MVYNAYHNQILFLGAGPLAAMFCTGEGAFLLANVVKMLIESVR